MAGARNEMNAIKPMIRNAATLILVAKNSHLKSYFDYRILLLERGTKSQFMPSFYVFPGGVIEKVDFSNDWMELFRQSFAKFGKDFTSLVNIQGPRPPVLKNSASTDMPSDVAFRICAIRETFEESGVLLWKSFSDDKNNNLDMDNIQSWRKEVYADASKFLTMCRKFECVPDVWSLSEWSNWLTPASLSRRYDTMFYICFLDNEPAVLHDEKEMTHSKWITPAEGVLKFRSRQIKVGFPQAYELSRFCRFPKWADFHSFQEGRATQGCQQWLPIILKFINGSMSVLPLDDLYPSLHDRVLEELSHSSTGQIPVLELSETLAELNSKGKNLHRVVIQSGTPYNFMCNVKLPFRQCLPVTDLVRIQELGTDVQKSHI